LTWKVSLNFWKCFKLSEWTADAKDRSMALECPEINVSLDYWKGTETDRILCCRNNLRENVF
jgi:hypothetical protein